MMTTSTHDLSEFHGDLSAVARDVLGTRASDDTVDWSLIARSGWLGLEAAAAIDGADATFAETAVILREIGRVAARGPYPAVAALALGALNAAEPTARRDDLLRRTVSGDAVPILVLDGEGRSGGLFGLDSCTDGWTASGSAEFVLGAPRAVRLLVPVSTADGATAIVCLDPTMPGVVVEQRAVVDGTREFARVSADTVRVESDSVWRLIGADPIARLRDRAAVAVACDSLGLGETMLETTVAYAGMREQFGRKIGSFQAVKHACADMLVDLTVARRLVASAVRKVSDGAPDATIAASMAKSFTSDMAVDIAGTAIQLHGGIGYTWESGLHVYLKRATLNRSLFGSPAQHRAVLAERYRVDPDHT